MWTTSRWSAFGAILLSSALSAQTPQTPNYSGTWQLVGNDSGRPQNLRIMQNATAITVAIDEDRATYELGRVVIQPSLHGATQITTGASWDGSKLRMVDVFWLGGVLGNVNERVLSIGPTGRLIVEATRRPASGTQTSTQTEWVRQ